MPLSDSASMFRPRMSRWSPIMSPVSCGGGALFRAPVFPVKCWAAPPDTPGPTRFLPVIVNRGVDIPIGACRISTSLSQFWICQPQIHLLMKLCFPLPRVTVSGRLHPRVHGDYSLALAMGICRQAFWEVSMPVAFGVSRIQEMSTLSGI
jgi:hypothetical protein